MGTRIAAGAIALSVGLIGVAAVPASAALQKGVSASQLNKIESNLSKSNHLTFEAVYTGMSGGKSISVTIAQAPPKSNFTISSGSEVINNGKATYFCSSSSGKESCFSESGPNPFLSIESLYTAAPVVSALSSAKSSLLSRLAGYKVVSNSASFAGQSATCLSITVRGNKTGKYCVTSKGILAYSGISSTQYFQLSRYSASPPSSLFQLPAGATTQTIPSIPSGVTLPGGGTIPSIPGGG